MNKKENMQVERIIKLALEEDIGSGDITTGFLVSARAKTKAMVLVHEPGVICGMTIARRVFEVVNKNHQGKGVKFIAKVKDGERVKRGQKIAEISGDARVILTAERVALNFLQRLSGIAALTGRYVDVVSSLKLKHSPKIIDTRKMTPGLRYLEKYAVRCGGGHNHRMGLYDMVLVKDNHLQVIKSAFNSLENGKELESLIKKVRKKMPKKIKIEVEVENISQLKQVIKLDVDIIMLDNMRGEILRKAVEMIHQKRNKESVLLPLIEVSGGINLENIKQLALLGIERISIGKLTSEPKALDISMEIK